MGEARDVLTGAPSLAAFALYALSEDLTADLCPAQDDPSEEQESHGHHRTRLGNRSIVAKDTRPLLNTATGVLESRAGCIGEVPVRSRLVVSWTCETVAAKR